MPERGWFENKETHDRVAALERHGAILEQRLAALEHKYHQLVTVFKLAPVLAELERIEEQARRGIREIPIDFSGQHPVPPLVKTGRPVTQFPGGGQPSVRWGAASCEDWSTCYAPGSRGEEA